MLTGIQSNGCCATHSQQGLEQLVREHQCVNRDVFYKYTLLQAALMRALARGKGTLRLWIILLFQ